MEKEDYKTEDSSFGEAFRFWLKLGFISFGGPAGQIALMHKELVERKKWISEDNFLHALNFCMLLPGPEAQQLATYNGWRMHGIKGGIVAGVFFVLPSVFILLALSYIYVRFGSVAEVSAVLDGLKAVVVAIVVEAVIKIGKKAFKNRFSVAIAALSFIAIFIFKVPFPLIVLGAGFLGFLYFKLQRNSGEEKRRIAESEKIKRDEAENLKFEISNLKLKTKDEDPETENQSSKIEDQKSKLEDQSSFSQSQIANRKSQIPKIVSIFVLLWLIPFLLTGLTFGFSNLAVRLYLFFTQTAFVTFGGAYSVLAYVNQAAVESFGWLTTRQAIDGFALAETTPGPLIMVLQNIGFIAGWNNSGDANRTFFAVICALLTTYATFLPSFMFILVGAPYIEKLRGNQNLTSALSGVTAAVVGVILNLAAAFGATVIFPEMQLSVFAVTVAAAAFAALYFFKVDVLPVIFAAGICGLIKLAVVG